MKNAIKISTVIGFILFATLPVLAQHTLQTNLRNSNNTASTAVTLGKMYEGSIGRNFIRFRKLLALKDGEIRYDVKQKAVNERICLRFKADTALVQAFEMRLENDSLFLVQPMKRTKIGAYKVGDSFKIVRCKTGIVFYKNNSLLDAYTLPNNNFVMVGEVRADNTTLSKASVFFTAY